jgi:hypothetical protein
VGGGEREDPEEGLFKAKKVNECQTSGKSEDCCRYIGENGHPFISMDSWGGGGGGGSSNG